MSHAFEMSVKKGPATMQLTRTFGPYANANERVIALRPAFAAPYGSDVRLGFIDAVLLTLISEQPSRSAILLAISTDNRNGPFRFRLTTLSKRSSVTWSSDGYSGERPALFTRMSTLPNLP